MEDQLMINLFNQMDLNKGGRVGRSEFENWFIVKMPRINAHDRMKILNILSKEFKSRDTKKDGQLEWQEFKGMKT